MLLSWVQIRRLPRRAFLLAGDLGERREGLGIGVVVKHVLAGPRRAVGAIQGERKDRKMQCSRSISAWPNPASAYGCHAMAASRRGSPASSAAISSTPSASRSLPVIWQHLPIKVNRIPALRANGPNVFLTAARGSLMRP